MLKFIYANRLIIGVLTGVLLIVIGGTYFLKHLDNEKTLEMERNMRFNYQQWHLPEGAKARIGSGTIRVMQYSPDGNLLAVVSGIGVWMLDAQTAEPQHLLAAHTGMINSISFSSDGRTLAVGTGNGEAQLWDIATGEHQKTFKKWDYYPGVDTVFLMPDGHTLAVIRTAMVDLWDIATGKSKNTLSAVENETTDDTVNNNPIFYMSLGGHRNSFSADGKTVASDSGDDGFRFWDIATRKEVRTLKVEPSGKMRSFSSDLRTLAIASNSYKGQRHTKIWEINLWDVNTQTQRRVFETDGFIFEIPFLVFSPDGKLLASSVNSTIHIWDVNTGKLKKKFKEHEIAVTAVAFSPDNRTLVSVGYDDTLRFWDVDTGKVKKIVAGYGALFRDVSLSPDAQTLMSLCYGSSTVRLWNANTGQHQKNFIGDNKYVWGAALSPDGRRLASYSGSDNTIHLWDVNTGKHSKLKGPKSHVSGIALSRDSQVLASWGSSGRSKYVIQFYDADTGSKQRILQLTFEKRFRVPAELYFDKKMFAGIGFDANLSVWNLVTGDYNITDLGDMNIGVARLSPDGRVVAIVFGRFGRQSQRIVLRDVETRDHIRTLIEHTDSVESLAFSPDSRTLASGSRGIMREKTILLWDMETGSVSKVVTDPDWAETPHKYDAITASALAFSPDGQTLASGMKLGDIYLWETATGAKKKMLRGHSLRVSHIFFSADGQTLVSASDDGTILIWDLK